MQGGDDAFHPDLPEHGQGDPVFPAKPTPSSFHIGPVSPNGAKLRENAEDSKYSLYL
jgi:hypothetical protein